jgi:hypothetical protein
VLIFGRATLGYFKRYHHLRQWIARHTFLGYPHKELTYQQCYKNHMETLGVDYGNRLLAMIVSTLSYMLSALWIRYSYQKHVFPGFLSRNHAKVTSTIAPSDVLSLTYLSSNE